MAPDTSSEQLIAERSAIPAQAPEDRSDVPATAGAKPRHRLRPGDKMRPGASLTSPSGRYRFTYQKDGNLVLYDGTTPLWASDTAGQAAGWVRMRKTGALVIRVPSGEAIWQTPTNMLSSTLSVQNDGNVVIYDPQGTAQWATNTWLPTGPRAKGSQVKAGQVLEGGDEIISPNGRARLVYQNDGNLVVYNQGNPTWATHTDGRPVGVAVMQNDGNLVIYVRGGEVIYATGTRTPGAVLTAEDAGDVAMTGPDGHVLRRFPAEPVLLCLSDPVAGVDYPERKDPPQPPKINQDGTISNIGVIHQPLAGETVKMWDIGATVRVKFLGGSTTIRNKVQGYAHQWSQFANLDFDFVGDDQSADIRVNFRMDGGWNSKVGRDATGVWFDGETMNLALDDTSDESDVRRHTLHEFGHALGLIHEHQSPAAGIPWDREKVYAYFKDSNGWDRDTVDVNIFRRYDARTTNYSAFDPASVMCYPIPASLLLEGDGFGGATELSDKDKEYIRRWYPGPVTPEHASGMLRTGDDCDEIDFTVEYGVVEAWNVSVVLKPGSGIDWWKGIEMPTAGGNWDMIQMQDGNTAGQNYALTDLDGGRAIRFWKAKTFGVHTRLGYTWDVVRALTGGCRVTLFWKRDHC